MASCALARLLSGRRGPVRFGIRRLIGWRPRSRLPAQPPNNDNRASGTPFTRPLSAPNTQRFDIGGWVAL